MRQSLALPVGPRLGRRRRIYPGLFNPGAAAAGTTNSAWPHRGLSMRDIIAPPVNGIPAHPRDFNQALDPAAAPLQRQQAHELPPAQFVERNEHTINGPVLFRRRTLRVFPTGLAGAGMNR